MSRGPLITIALTTRVGLERLPVPLLVGPRRADPVLTVALGVFLQQSPNTQPDWTGLMPAPRCPSCRSLTCSSFLGKRLVQSLNFTGIK